MLAEKYAHKCMNEEHSYKITKLQLNYQIQSTNILFQTHSCPNVMFEINMHVARKQPPYLNNCICQLTILDVH